jgi:outer membrane protein OmpA-like peptidoglycan-associated protein
VAEALASKYGIAAARMTARGVANLAPVASNASDEGRARNRRVELVAR